MYVTSGGSSGKRRSALAARTTLLVARIKPSATLRITTHPLWLSAFYIVRRAIGLVSFDEYPRFVYTRWHRLAVVLAVRSLPSRTHICMTPMLFRRLATFGYWTLALLSTFISLLDSCPSFRSNPTDLYISPAAARGTDTHTTLISRNVHALFRNCCSTSLLLRRRNLLTWLKFRFNLTNLTRRSNSLQRGTKFQRALCPQTRKFLLAFVRTSSF